MLLYVGYASKQLRLKIILCVEVQRKSTEDILGRKKTSNKWLPQNISQ